MRFQGELRPAGAPEGVEPRWRLTDEVRGQAQSLAAALTAAGFPSEVSFGSDDDAGADEGAPDGDGSGIVEWAEVQVAGDDYGQPQIVLNDGGGTIHVDTFAADEQEQYVRVYRVLRVANETIGWTLRGDDRTMLAAQAHFYGVDPNGEVTVPRTIGEDELQREVARIVAAADPVTDRPRPEHLTRSASLDALAGLIENNVKTSGRWVWWPAEGAVGSPAHDGLDDIDVFDYITGLYSELGDDRHGRPTEVEIALERKRLGRSTVTATVRFDVLPERERIAGSSPFEWEDTVAQMSRRDPEWVPDWVRDVVAMMRRAGRDVSPFDPSF